MKTGIMVPETCSADGWLTNHNCCIKLVSQIISSNSFKYNSRWTLKKIIAQNWIEKCEKNTCACIKYLRTMEAVPRFSEFWVILTFIHAIFRNYVISVLNSSPSIFRFIKSRIYEMGVGHTARMGDRRGVYRILVGNPGGNRPLRRPRIRWGIILKWIFRK
jgi:hypothetical protein